jgi:hypothetical protein
VSVLARQRAMTQRVLRHFSGAATATLKVISAASFAESTTLERTNSFASHTVPIFVHQVAKTDGDGAVVLSQRLRVSIPALGLPAGVVPTSTSQLVIGGITHRVLGAEPSAPDGVTVIAYELDLSPIAGVDQPAQ